jgi:Phage integrase family
VKRMRGDGRVYLPKNSTIYMSDYWINGHRVRCSTGCRNEREAWAWLRARQAEIATGNYTGHTVSKIMVSELIKDVLDQHRIDGTKSIVDEERHWRLHLEPFFGNLRAVQISTELLRNYVKERKKQLLKWDKPPENSTINRELALLRSAFYLGYEATPPKVIRVPTFPMLEEDNTREGFLQDEGYEKLAAEAAKVGLWMRGLVAVYNSFGWRRSEPLGKVRVRQVDLPNRTIDLNPGATKNKEARVIKMTQEVYAIVSMCVEGKSPDDLVFTREDGKPIGDFRKTWYKMCCNAGLGRMACRKCDLTVMGDKCECGCEKLHYVGLLVHDLRRTGCRNLRRLGVHEKTIMKIGGWKTRSVFDRYNIVDESDLADAAARLDRKAQRAKRHSKGTVVPEVPSNGKASSVN